MSSVPAIRIPKRFFDDHENRDCQSPEVIRETKAHYFIDGTPSPGLADLYSDADLYRNPADYEREYFGLCRSAAATFAAIGTGLTADQLDELRTIDY